MARYHLGRAFVIIFVVAIVLVIIWRVAEVMKIHNPYGRVGETSTTANWSFSSLNSTDLFTQNYTSEFATTAGATNATLTNATLGATEAATLGATEAATTVSAVATPAPASALTSAVTNVTNTTSVIGNEFHGPLIDLSG
ncbi:hypothetical pox protein [Squirrelpox virus]|uniref:Hypothetical pox protein n=1 Tax=Squirrelpox virus TaxID=240426 RepID=Q1HTV0_9POXV|nr:hypothetical pox protein [Squirrelpox virus]ABD51436.1 K2L [Squirrelpox virus]CCD83185.1 hypothetical pox protein [Squirrelpox virus]